MVWYGIVLYGMVWYGMVVYGLERKARQSDVYACHYISHLRIAISLNVEINVKVNVTLTQSPMRRSLPQVRRYRGHKLGRSATPNIRRQSCIDQNRTCQQIITKLANSQIPSDPIRSRQIPSDPIRSHQIPSDPVRSHHIPSDPI